MGLSSMSRFHLDFDVVDRLATEPKEWRRWVRGEEMDYLETKGVKPELEVLAAAKIGPGSERRTRSVRPLASTAASISLTSKRP